MDVHPPHQPIHSWQDFLVHLVTITIGLLIALSLEAAVQAMHYRHLVRDTHQNLRREIENNRKLYVFDVKEVQLNRDQLAGDIDQLRQLRNGVKLEHPALSWRWGWDSFSDAEWKTAAAAGALAHMDSGWIATYSWTYAQQDYIDATALAIITEETRVGARLQVAQEAAKLSPADIEELLIKSAEIDLSLGTLQTTMKALDDMYADALNKT